LPAVSVTPLRLLFDRAPPALTSTALLVVSDAGAGFNVEAAKKNRGLGHDLSLGEK
jgi:hypothetical protein